MSLFSDPTDIDSYGRNLAQLLLIGGVQFETLARGSDRVTFKVWAEAVAADSRKRGLALSDGQLEWLWDALTTEPRVAQELRGRIVSGEEEWRSREPVLTLKRGAELGLFLKPFTAFGAPVLPLPPEARPECMITLRSALMMQPGKAAARRFECCDVECELDIRAEKPGTAEQEAVLMKLKLDEVKVKDGRVIVHARSLNHAYTVASRRLQPHRRSHGGRAYDHVAWRKGNQWVTLENIRCAVEAGEWKAE